MVWVLPPGSFSSTPHRSHTWASAEPSSLFGLSPASAAPGDASPEVFARVHSDGGPGFPQASGFALKAATEVLLGQRSLPRAVTFHQTTANQEGEHGQGDTWSSYQQRVWTVHVPPQYAPNSLEELSGGAGALPHPVRNQDPSPKHLKCWGGDMVPQTGSKRKGSCLWGAGVWPSFRRVWGSWQSPAATWEPRHVPVSWLQPPAAPCGPLLSAQPPPRILTGSPRPPPARSPGSQHPRAPPQPKGRFAFNAPPTCRPIPCAHRHCWPLRDPAAGLWTPTRLAPALLAWLFLPSVARVVGWLRRGCGWRKKEN